MSVNYLSYFRLRFSWFSVCWNFGLCPRHFEFYVMWLGFSFKFVILGGSQPVQVQNAGPGPLCGLWFKFQFHFQSLGSDLLVYPTVCYPEANLEPWWDKVFQDSINQVTSINHGYLGSNSWVKSLHLSPEDKHKCSEQQLNP